MPLFLSPDPVPPAQQCMEGRENPSHPLHHSHTQWGSNGVIYPNPMCAEGTAEHPHSRALLPPYPQTTPKATSIPANNSSTGTWGTATCWVVG